MTAEQEFGPFFINCFGEKYLPTVNREAFSRVGAEACFQSCFGQGLWAKDSLFIVVGSDSGLLFDYVLKRGIPEGSRYLFIEFAEIIHHIQQEHPPATWPRNLILCTPEEWQVQAEAQALVDYFYLDAVKPILSLAVQDGWHSGYLELWSQVNKQLILVATHVKNSTGLALNFLVRVVENMAENRIPAIGLTGAYAGQTAVLLAGGPSMHTLLPWVRDHRDQVVVMAVSRVALPLQRAGIVPDMVFSIDPYDLFVYNSKEMLTFWREALFFSMDHAHPKLVGQWRGPQVYMGNRYAWTTPKEPDNCQMSGITVSHYALGMAARLGFAQVILMGVDLCFSREGLSHTRGSVESLVGPFMGQSDLLVETNGGWQAETSYDFYLGIPAMAAVAEEALRQGCRVINPAPEAARIPHVDHLPLTELACTPLSAPPRTIWEQWLPVETRESRLHHYAEVLEALDEVIRQVREVIRLTQEAQRCNDRLFGRLGQPPDFRYKREMDAIEEYLNQKLTTGSTMVRQWGVADFLKLSRPDKEREWQDAEIEEIGRRYYEIYCASAEKLLLLLEKNRERILSRQEEEASQPDWGRLIAQWQQDDQPGRLFLVLDRRGMTLDDLPDSWHEAAQKLVNAYQHFLTSEQDPYRTYCRNKLNPVLVRSKAHMLFRSRERERLGALVAGLQRSNMVEKEQHIQMIQGYITELEGDLRKAEFHYRQVTTPVLLEDAMGRIVALALQQQDFLTAQAVLRRLAEYSPIHLPALADLLRLLNKPEEALTAYRQYLERVGRDPVTLLKMSRFCLELGRHSEAEHHLRELLQESPGNQAAQELLIQMGSNQHFSLEGHRD